MTAVGKLLVFANLVAAVALVTWAGSLYANRLDWVDRATEAGAVKGELTTLKEAVDQAAKAAAEASRGYARRSAEVLAVETRRAARQQIFDNRLTKARTAQFTAQVPGDGPLIDLNQEGPVIRDLAGNPLRGVDALQDEYSVQVREADDAARAAADLRQRYEDASRQIAAVEGKVQVQRVILAALADEQRFLADLRVNWDEELRALAARLRQLPPADRTAATPAARRPVAGLFRQPPGPARPADRPRAAGEGVR